MAKSKSNVILKLDLMKVFDSVKIGMLSYKFLDWQIFWPLNSSPELKLIIRISFLLILLTVVSKLFKIIRILDRKIPVSLRIYVDWSSIFFFKHFYMMVENKSSCSFNIRRNIITYTDGLLGAFGANKKLCRDIFKTQISSISIVPKRVTLASTLSL